MMIVVLCLYLVTTIVTKASILYCHIVADVLVRRETVLGGEVPPLLAEDPLPPRDIQRSEEH